MNAQLNLARKWRPQTFDSVVGQEIPVRMLKNSLFTNKLFPVYLFAGQRGCGKTTSARIFAAALNCFLLEKFQKDPSIKIPCLACTSCTAMLNGSHPDYIEIDAASHTGVDHVRQLIESSSYLPLLSHKKIYLIDEAHMLSKAAFNALLKLLEEPPMSVHFMLATTEIPKLPQTILSRCFQLSFGPLKDDALKKHLKALCTDEGLTIEDAALDVIYDESEGSARDAINILERVRFSSDHITADGVLNILGKIRVADLIELLEHIIVNDAQSLIAKIVALDHQHYAAASLWDSLITLIKQVAFCKMGHIQATGHLALYNTQIKNIADSTSLNRIQAMLQLLWTQEPLFLQTNKKNLFIQTVLMQLCSQVNIADLTELLSAKSPSSTAMPVATKKVTAQSLPTQTVSQSNNDQSVGPVKAQTNTQQVPAVLSDQKEENSLWVKFQTEISSHHDQLLVSILKQSSLNLSEQNKGHAVLKAPKNSFFLSKLEETRNIWHPVLSLHYEGIVSVSIEGELVLENTSPRPPLIKPLTTAPAAAPQKQQFSGSGHARESEYFTIKNASEWPSTSMIMNYFPGRLKKL